MAPQRIMFWQIDHVWLFYVLAGLASLLFLAGMTAHLIVWKKNAGSLSLPFSRTAFNRMILDVFLGRRILKGELAAGLMHLLIFWGFLLLLIGTAILAAHHYVFTFLTGIPYLAFSITMEIAGIMLTVGTIWALIRRYIQRVPRLERRLEDITVPIWILLVGLSGFALEGLRLAYEQPAWAGWSFAGTWIGGLLSTRMAEAVYPAFWWGHIILSLSLIAVIPFTKLFHILGAPASIYLQGFEKSASPDFDENAAEFDLGDSVFFDACMRCGRCVAVCPSAGAKEPFAPRDFIQAMRRSLWQTHSPFGDIRFLLTGEKTEADKNFWYCTTCRACLEVCPVYGASFESVIKNRILAIEDGTQVPKLLNQTLEKLARYDNPWESSKKQRDAWAKDLQLPDLTKKGVEADLCYFVGCTTSFDDTAQEIARSFAKILNIAGISFGILGNKEPCCGDIARRVGELGLFYEQMDNCLDLFDRYGITEVVTSSPHCFHTFQNEYPQAPFRARHYTLLLHEILVNGRLRFDKQEKTKVTYHDPCYLGRHNRIFDEPRKIIRSIPGIELVEMPHNRENSRCCGGGGGRMWQDLPSEVKMSEIRIREAEATGANILVTACPLCRIMLEDARKATGLNKTLRVMDLNALVLQALASDDADV
ncbi:MAG: 4Fe-4S dicluster domain-containing protein [Deltaproteobacteria bacterium]|nr:4Fe-4S dicluster domain-containing protein [Deltaproteobacteria bacterium]